MQAINDHTRTDNIGNNKYGLPQMLLKTINTTHETGTAHKKTRG